MMMTIVIKIINSNDDDNEESNSRHFSWREYKHFFIRHLVIRSDIILLYACVYVYRPMLQPMSRLHVLYTKNTRLITLHDTSKLQKGQAI